GADGIQRTARIERWVGRQLRIDMLSAVVRASFDADAQGERRDPALAQRAARFETELGVVGGAIASTHSRQAGIERCIRRARPGIRERIEALIRIARSERSGELERIQIGGVAIRQSMVQLESTVPVPRIAHPAFGREEAGLSFRRAVSLY